MSEQAGVTVRMQGGLGNQMFQYAAGLALAQRLGAQLHLDISDFQTSERAFQLHELSIQEPTDGRRPMGSRLRGGRPYRAILARCGRLYQEPSFHFDERFWQCRAPVYIEGYFQSWRYAEAIRETLQERFSLKNRWQGRAAEMAADIEKASAPVSVHIRRGDYTTAKNSKIHGVLSREYYARAREIILSTVPNACFFVFSDDIMEAKKVWHNWEGVFVDGMYDRPWEEIHMMAKCRANILANSSFSWWGAWLNRRRDKKVVAPREWFSVETLRLKNTCDLLPPGTILV